MSLVVCLFLQLLFSAFWSDAQMTTSDRNKGEDCNSNLEYIRQSLQKIYQRLDQQNCSLNGADCLAQKSSCPPGFNYSVNAVSKCYYIDDQPMNWTEASAKCSRLHPDANLAVVNSALEDQVISRILEKHECRHSTYGGWFWVGGRRTEQNCSSPLQWRPSNRIYQPLGYTNFCPREPDCDSKVIHDCLAIVKDCWSRRNTYGWQDDLCHKPLCAICEIVKID